jgi:hypothetical protein
VIGISEKIYHHLVERLMNEQGQILKKAVKDHMWNCKQILTNDEPPEVKP